MLRRAFSFTSPSRHGATGSRKQPKAEGTWKSGSGTWGLTQLIQLSRMRSPSPWLNSPRKTPASRVSPGSQARPIARNVFAGMCPSTS
jgi:hypothetical protein